MFDIGWTELLLIGIVALIVVGPKDLPGMFRTLGKFTARMRSMAREFQRSMDEAADGSGMRDVARDLRKMTSPREMGLDAVRKATSLDDPDEDDAAKPATPKGAKGKGAKAPAPLSEEREEARRKIAERTAAAARARSKPEAQAEAAPEPEPATETAPGPAPDGDRT